jgi:hypothetical protein
MHTLILPYSESDSDILAFIERLRSKNKPFKIHANSNLQPANDAHIVWNWENADNAAYEMSLASWAEDWDSDADKVWDNQLSPSILC